MLALVPQIYIYDVHELIELCLEDPGIDVEHDAHDEVNQIKKLHR